MVGWATRSVWLLEVGPVTGRVIARCRDGGVGSSYSCGGSAGLEPASCSSSSPCDNTATWQEPAGTQVLARQWTSNELREAYARADERLSFSFG